MNYIAEINSFYSWVMFNSLPPDAQALWHVLMQMNNKCSVKVGDKWYWRVEFSIPNRTLLSVLNFSRQQLDRMRNALIQAGRIVYKKGKGNQSGTYKIIPFDSSLVDNYVENYPHRLWITCVANNVTQTDTQSDTQVEVQSGHKPMHKADTEDDLCNIIGTQTNSYINNNIINNINKNNNFLFGDDDETHARAYTPDKSLSDYLPELNTYFGMSEEIKKEVECFTKSLFDKYFTRKPSKTDIINVFMYCRHSQQVNGGVWRLWLDEDKQEVLEYAFEQASRAGTPTWAYIEGILTNLRQRGLKTKEDCEEYDVDRDIDKHGLY